MEFNNYHENLLQRVETISRFVRDQRPKQMLAPTMRWANAPTHLKVISLQENLVRRQAELSEIACNMFASSKELPGLLITRSIMETTAILFFLKEKVEAAINSRSRQHFDTELLHLLNGFGITVEDSLELKFSKFSNIKFAIDRLEGWIKGFRWQYDAVCELTHPEGYPQAEPSPGATSEEDEGKPSRPGNDFAFLVGVNALTHSLTLAVTIYDDLVDMLPRFVELSDASEEPEELPVSDDNDISQ